MDNNVSASVRGLLVGGLVLLALVTAYLMGNEGIPAADAAPKGPTAAEPVATPGTLTMTGSGEAGAVPDQVTFDLSVGVTRPALEDALDEASRTLDRVLGRLRGFGVEKGDVETTGLSMNPVYDYYSGRPPVLRGYRVTQRAGVLVEELKQAGGAIAAAVDAGAAAVRVGDIRLRIGDPEAALVRARLSAVAEATAKAQEYAAATGQELGEVVTLREMGDQARSRVTSQALERSAAYDSTSLKALPLRSGRAELAVTVEVVWAFAE